MTTINATKKWSFTAGVLCERHDIFFILKGSSLSEFFFSSSFPYVSEIYFPHVHFRQVHAHPHIASRNIRWS